jgi:hypothetical protein
LTARLDGCILKVEREAKVAALSARPLEKGEYVIPHRGSPLGKGGSYIEPVHKKGGYRLPRLTGC